MSDADLRSLAYGQKHQTARYRCPQCWADRRNKLDNPLSLSVIENRAVWLCHHCGYKGAARLEEGKSVVPFRPKVAPAPPPKPLAFASSPTEDEVVYQWLSTRGITRPVAQTCGVKGGFYIFNGQRDVACAFLYGSNTEPYAIKWRALGSKEFSQTGAANTLWNAERIEKGAPVTITEGELDCLSLWQAGIPAVSVPNGAPSTHQVPHVGDMDISNPPDGSHGDRKFGYIWAARVLIEAASKVIIAVDADEPGNILGEEIARRVGRARCWKALWPDGCKDANDVLTRHGAEVLRECIEQAQPWPVKGLYEAEHFHDQVDTLYQQGLAKGQSTGYANVDKLYTIVPGQLCIVTGIPSMGKSSFIDQVMVNLAYNNDWRFAVCSFENEPRIHIAKLCQLYIGKPFFQGPTERMDHEDMVRGTAWINDHFSFLYQGDGALSPIEDIIERLRAAVMRYGIRGAIIDPANFVDRPADKSETDWVSDALTKLKVFAMAYDVHIWFVAHPTKLQRIDGRQTVPGGYDISGSAHWFNKADVGMTVHRPDYNTLESEVHIWKCRFNWIGKPGSTTLTYEPATGRYSMPPQSLRQWLRD